MKTDWDLQRGISEEKERDNVQTGPRENHRKGSAEDICSVPGRVGNDVMMSSQPTPSTKTLQSNNQYQSVISFRTMNIFQLNALAGLPVYHFQSVRHVSNVKLKNNWGLFN